jgi:hypothetical protein
VWEWGSGGERRIAGLKLEISEKAKAKAKVKADSSVRQSCTAETGLEVTRFAKQAAEEPTLKNQGWGTPRNSM